MYVLKRILAIIPCIIGITLIVFCLARVLPGDPITMYAGENASEMTIAQVTEELGLNQPIYKQLISYVKDLFHGDLGYAWHTSNSVMKDFADRLPATLELALFSMLLAIFIGVPLGILAAIHKNGIIDHISRILTLIGASVPNFWLGLMLVFVFYYLLHIAPAPMGRLPVDFEVANSVTGMYLIDGLITGDFVLFTTALKYLICPALTLGAGTLAIIARMTRTSMLEVLNQDFVRTAKAKGMSGKVVIWKHALSNALIPILTVIGSQFGILMGVTVVTETIFSWPGIGSYLTQSILVTDYAPIQAVALLGAIIYTLVNLVLDLVYMKVDPRIKK